MDYTVRSMFVEVVVEKLINFCLLYTFNDILYNFIIRYNFNAIRMNRVIIYRRQKLYINSISCDLN